MELSLCMIVKNEEARLPQCLESVRGAVDEIVIVDTGSTDATREVAGRYAQRVVDFAWEDDFAAARNVSFSYATKPYILWLDADDVLERSEKEKLIALKHRLDGHVDAVMMPYHYAYHSDGTPSLVFMRERIVRREAGFVFSGVVHEAMHVSGCVIEADIAVRHTGTHGEISSRRNLAIYEAWLARGRRMEGRDLYYYARELEACREFSRAEQAFSAFLAQNGWTENRLDAHVQRGHCLRALGRPKEAREAYMAALGEGVPRAEALCALGELLLEDGETEAAAFWFQAALASKPPLDSGAFVFSDAYGYIPAMQLCICYDRLGQTQLAAQMNERALLMHPHDEAALKNRAYFEKKLAAQR